MTTSIDYPAALDATHIETVVAAIRANYSAHEVHIRDAETLCFGYWDTATHSVATDVLCHIQTAGYRLRHIGQKVAPESGQRQAWMECQKYAPGESDRTLTCPRCGDTFTPVGVPSRIDGPWSASYSCPACPNRFEAAPPRPALCNLDGGEHDGR